MFTSLKWQKITSSLSFDMPLKLRGMINILVHLHTNHTSSYLILNDFLSGLSKIKRKKTHILCIIRRCCRHSINVSSFYFILLIFYIL